ncbi:MAG: PD-(D/E)XK nuclease family protein [Bacillota bacterium]|nr:PD-(D/E)XK nuclease family protein [Bacillota bacterium]
MKESTANKNLIPEGFLFTQHSLSTFDNCPLKFKKRYIENLKWNSYPDENVKKRLDMGNDFHLIAYRYFLGIEEENIADEELLKWLDNLKRSFPLDKNNTYLPEYKIRMADSIFMLEANLDLVIAKNNELQIWDWKTHTNAQGAKKGKKSSGFSQKLQTIVYMFALKEQSKRICGMEVPCDNICMNYWQPDPPKTIETIFYSDEKHGLFKEAIESRIKKIMNYDYSEFNKEDYLSHCAYCEFNWFCNNEKINFQVIFEDDDFLDSLNWDDLED